MSRSMLKKQIYAGLLEILKEDRLYYKSSVGHNFNNFSDEGKEELIKFFSMVAPYILEQEKKELEQLAKDMVWTELNK